MAVPVLIITLLQVTTVAVSNVPLECHVYVLPLQSVFGQLDVFRIHVRHILLENVQHCEPEQAATMDMHMNRLSFTLK